MDFLPTRTQSRFETCGQHVAHSTRLFSGLISMLLEKQFMYRTSTIIAALILPVASFAQTEDYPRLFVDKGACPFECCTYREWDALEKTQLFSEPKSNSHIVGYVEKGAKVLALTGEVHTKPGKLIVRRDVTLFKHGDILWVYTYLGEGYFKIWNKGRFIEDQVDFNWNNPSADDWGYFEYLPDSTWWVKIKLPDGLEGWTNQPEHFSNKDACG